MSVDSGFGKATVTPKSNGMYMCFRNLDHSRSPDMHFEVNMAGSYDPSSGGPYELSYSRIRHTGPDVPGVTVFHDSNQANFDETQDHHPIYQFRNSLSRAPQEGRGLLRIGGGEGGWPVEVEREIFVSDEPFYLDNQPTNADVQGAYMQFGVGADPIGEAMRLPEDSDLLGQYGADVAGELTD